MTRSRGPWRVALLLIVLAMVGAACAPEEAATPAEAPAETTTTGAAQEEASEEEEEAPTEASDFGEPVALTLGHPFPAQHPIQVNMMEPYAEAVNEATDGTVSIELHPGGALAAAPATFENTVAGGQDLGWALQGYHAGVFPVTEVVELPFQFTSATQATQTLWDLYDEFPALQNDYRDVKLLALWVHDVGDLFTRDTQVTTIEDVNGLTLRFPSRIMGEVIRELGASPVGMPAPEIFDSLSTGVIDGLAIAVSGLQSFQLYPVLNYWTVCNCYVAAQYLVMNLDTWNSLTPDTQAVMEELGREFSLTAAETYDGAYVQVSEIALDEGLEQYVLPDDELARWHEVGQVVVDAWIAEREADGIPAQEMFDRMQEIKAQYEN